MSDLNSVFQKRADRAHEDVHSTRHDFLIVQAAVMPTRVLPAPHGSTIIPDLARLEQGDEVGHNIDHVERAYPFPNILLRLVS